MSDGSTRQADHEAEVTMERLVAQRDRARTRGNRAVRCLAVLTNLHDGPPDRMRREGEAAWQSARELLDSEKGRP